MANESRVPVPAEINVFFQHPSGFRGHIKLMPPDANGVVKAYEALVQSLVNAGCVPDHVRTGGGNGGSGPAQEDAGVRCKKCGGEVYDNRQNKRNPKGPDYKCKDAKCGDAGWIGKDGTVSWASERN